MSTFSISKAGRILSAIFVFVLLLSASSSAQNRIAEPLSHEYDIYIDEESEQLFWPKSLPVHVWLSTSPEQNSPKHLLNSAEKRNSEETSRLEQSKIDLELSGNQYLRWINYETKDTLMFRFQSDGIPPVSEILLSGSQISETASVEFRGENLKAEINATDLNSGVANIYISVNGAEFTPYFGMYGFNQEKEYNVSFYAVDRVGNVEDMESVSFTVDLTPPSTRHQIEGTHQGSILASSAEITLSSVDQLSGVESMYFYFNEEDTPSTYTEAINIASLEDGSHTLYYYAADKVGNVEQPNVFEFYLDKTTPITNLIVEGDQFENGDFFVSPRTQYRLETKDNKTGISKISYRINEEAENSFSDRAFRLQETPGAYSLTYWATDNVNNSESFNNKQFILDAASPKSDHAFDGLFFTQRGRTWISSLTKVLMSAGDSESGVKSIKYTIENESQETIYSEPLEFRNEGQYDITYTSVDQVNNKEKVNRLSIVVDNTPPKLMANFSSAKIGSSSSNDGSVLDQYPLNTVLYLAATDESSGAEGIWYSLNDDQEKPFTGSLKFNDTGEQKVVIKSKDRVGNEVLETLRFIIAE